VERCEHPGGRAPSQGPAASATSGARVSALAVDLGNSRLKLVRFGLTDARAPVSAVEPVDTLTLEWSALGPDGPGALAESLDLWLARAEDGAPLCFAALSSVAGGPRTAAVRARLAAAGVERVLAAPEPGLAIATRTPETVGHDRLYAARGALERLGAKAGGGALVLDAGTALTVDAVGPPGPEDARPRFLGGAIAPGPGLQAKALAREAAQLPEVTPRPGAAAWGRDTAGAIEAGVVVGFRGAAARLLDELGDACALGGAPVVLTGGARAFLLEPEPFVALRALVVDPWLVERGLVAAGLDAIRREEGA